MDTSKYIYVCTCTCILLLYDNVIRMKIMEWFASNKGEVEHIIGVLQVFAFFLAA